MASEDAVATLTEALARLGRGRSVKQDDSDAVALDAVEQGTKPRAAFDRIVVRIVSSRALATA